MDGERDLTTPTLCNCSSLDEKIDATLASIVKTQWQMSVVLQTVMLIKAV